jgi:hypothetical protein
MNVFMILILFFTGVNPCKTPAYGIQVYVRAYGASAFQFHLFLHLLHSHLWLRSVLNLRVYESSLSGLSPQNKIENSTINAPTIGIISAKNAGMFGMDLGWVWCRW